MRIDQTIATKDARDVKVASTNASTFAYVADGENGFEVVQLLSPEWTPAYAGFSPRPEPRLIAHRKTAGQVCLRFLVQEGAIVIPRTSKIERLTENMSIFDFELGDAEMDEIRKLATPRGRIVEWGGAPDWDE